MLRPWQQKPRAYMLAGVTVPIWAEQRRLVDLCGSLWQRPLRSSGCAQGQSRACQAGLAMSLLLSHPTQDRMGCELQGRGSGGAYADCVTGTPPSLCSPRTTPWCPSTPPCPPTQNGERLCGGAAACMQGCGVHACRTASREGAAPPTTRPRPFSSLGHAPHIGPHHTPLGDDGLKLTTC